MYYVKYYLYKYLYFDPSWCSKGRALMELHLFRANSRSAAILVFCSGAPPDFDLATTSSFTESTSSVVFLGVITLQFDSLEIY